MNAVSQQPGSASPVGVATAGYDPGWGYRSSLAFASGASSVWSTQADGIHLSKWSIQLPNGVKMDGDRLYTYDASKDNLSQAGEWSLVHDHLGRLVGASASSLGNYSATYGYDAFDNNTSASVSGATPPQAIGFTFGALPLNRTPGTTSGGSATGWTYDTAGEATNFAAAPGSSSVTGLQWDGLGRMVQANAPGLTETEGYAPSGLRVRRDETVASYSRRFVYTSGGLLLAEYAPKAGGGWQWNRDVVYLGSQAIAEVDGAGTHELHSDHLGTPRVITESVAGTATLTGRQNYGPYGETFPAMDSGYVPLTGYTGHLQADPTGLIYMRGRFYTPSWHRFVNSDQGADPSTWNQMAYVGGNPMQATDPSGFKERVVCDSGTLLYEYTDDDGFTHTAIIGFCNSGGGGGSYHLSSSAGDYGFSSGSNGSYVVNTSQVGVTNYNGSISWGGTSTISVDYGQATQSSGADFATLSLGWEEIGNLNVNITLTRHGQVYVAPAVGGGVSLTAVQANLAFGTMSGSNSAQDMNSFFKGFSTNIGYSLAVFGYGTSNNSSGSTDEYVIGTPGGWANVSYGWNIFNLPGIGW